MKNQRLKQFAASLLVVFSLVASSLAAACNCSHHQEAAKTHLPSCHQHSPEAQTEHHHDLSETIQTVISQNECCCIQPAPKVYAKAESVKIEKQNRVVAPSLPIQTVFVSQIVLVEVEFTAPFHLTDSFHNIKSPRAPPRS